MYQARGARKQSFSPKLAIILVVVLVVGIFVLRVVTRTLSQPRDGANEATDIVSVYSAHVEKQTDVVKLTKNGDALVRKNMPQFAALNYKRASDLNKESRDAAYGWAYATVQANANGLGESALNDISTALDRIEKVDPYYEPMLRLKLTVAEIKGDTQTVTAIKERMQLLGIK